MFKANGSPGRLFDKLVQQFHSLNENNQYFDDTEQTLVSLPMNIRSLFHVLVKIHDHLLISFQP